MDDAYEQRLGAKLATIEELRLELDSEGIECPGVLVVGAQSAGKSSVLERLTGIDFPRAANTCTRVPTIVQLQTDSRVELPRATIARDSKLQEGAMECGSMSEIREAIVKFTEESIDEERSIRDEPIHIRYVRSSGPVMTLIDLPGITHVDVKNEGFDIHEVTASMVRRYVNNENMIALVVIPANDDFGNSEALNIAQTFDKEGYRTIGVVSKSDLVPEKSDIVQKIQMTRESDVKLALGFIAVRNKGPEEEGIDIEAVEEELFRTHPLLMQLKESERGYQALSKKIVDLQSDRVSRFIPEARIMVRNKIEEIKRDLDRIGYTPYSHSERNNLLTKELCDMDSTICKLIRAESCKEASINVSARTYELSQEFAKAVHDKVPDCLGLEFASKLREAMKETMGYSLPNFMSDQIFRDALTDIFFVDNLAPSTEMFIDDVADLMNHVFENVIMGKKTMKQFPKLASALVDESGQCVRRAQDRAKEITGAVIEGEKVQIYTQNSHYMDVIGQTKEAVMEEQKKEIAKQVKAQLRVQNGVTASSNHFEMSPGIPKDHYSGNSSPVRSGFVFGSDNGIRQESVKNGVAASSNHFEMSPGTSKGHYSGNSSPVRSGFAFGKDKNGIRQDFSAKYAKALATDTVEQSLMDLQISIHCYCDTVMRRLFDVIPMIVRSIMVHEVQNMFHCTMRGAFDDDNLEYMFSEDAGIQRERQKLQTRMQRMRNAKDKLRELH